MSFLLDTNILSETRRASGNAGVRRFIRKAGIQNIHLSVLTLGEVRRGAYAKLGNEPVFAAQLLAWLEQVQTANAGRIHAVTTEIAMRWGEFSSDRTRPIIDTLLAATAAVHGLTVVTRNTRDFEGLSIPVLNPWD